MFRVVKTTQASLVSPVMTQISRLAVHEYSCTISFSACDNCHMPRDSDVTIIIHQFRHVADWIHTTVNPE